MADENEHAARANHLVGVAVQETPSGQNMLERAQIEATLAVAYEQRTANLIAYQSVTAEGMDAAAKYIRGVIQEAPSEPTAAQEKSIETMVEGFEQQQRLLLDLAKEVRARLGLEAWDAAAAELAKGAAL